MSAQQDQTQGNIEVTKDSIIDSICNSVIDAIATSLPLISAKGSISNSAYKRLREYYVPRVVSIGPYHFGTKKLKLVEKLNELADVGIHFKPNNSMSLTSVEFSKGWMRFTANVKLPRTIVNGSTKHILLNLIAYETCLCTIDDARVTSYVCLLDSLIDQPEDVKILRKSWQLKNEYFKSPWAIFVLLGALLGLFLTAVQTYSSLTGECDDLCKFLKKNHHL
ncbi:uncharacterized protein LOC143588406 [Bidens hawaiensis]|uniref:uncharacterized protein LOC143588406 n=1 Tax=Bidens hawaiensis TaxID=980011 RepID=UPI00404ABE24